MSSFTININSAQFSTGFNQLEQKVTTLQPFYKDVGEALTKQIDGFFKTGIGADGQPWQANAFSTVGRYIKQRGGYSANGSLNKRGVQLAGSKKVLQGITGELRRTNYYKALNDSLIIGNPKPYAAIQTFGGDFKAWGRTTITMPARPFMPVDKAGNLYPAAAAIIQRRLLIHLQNATR